MALDYELARMFAKMTNDQGSRVSEATVQGTVKEYAGGMYVQLDGSDLLTPVSSTTGMKDGDRVNVMIKDHSATVTGNTTAPSATKDDTDIIQGQLDDTVDQISEFEIVLAGKVDTEVLNAQIARIDSLTADNVVIKESLSATEANIKDLQAENVAISGQLDAFEADIDNLHANMLTAEAADLKYATIENLEATDAKIYNLEGTYAEFEQTVTEKLTATDASIENLEATKLSAEEADLKYANIDFANIGKAAIENFFSKSGMIGDLVVGEGTITGTLVGVTIKGDLIEGGTVVADKLVIKGEDGLYYKLNTDGETVESSQTDYNSLNGSVITAKSITATKISVDDLVAFDATIGGFKITESSIYSGVKESIDNTTRGIFMDDTGQMALGDQSNYLKYFKDTDGVWKLIISAGSIKLGGSSKDIETAFDEINQKIENVEGMSPIETVSGEGYASIGENGGKKPYEIVIYGKTRQNLWRNPVSVANYGVKLVETDGILSMSGTATSTGAIVTPPIYTLKPNTTYYISLNAPPPANTGFYIYERDANNNITRTITVPSAGGSFTMSSSFAYVRFGFYVNTGAVLSGSYRIMLNEGDKPEPYCLRGLHSIGDVDYTSSGSNLACPVSGINSSHDLDFVSHEDGSFDLSGSYLDYTSIWRKATIKTLTPGETYSMNFTADSVTGFTGAFFYVEWFHKNDQGNDVYYGSANRLVNNGYGSFTIPSDATSMVMSIYLAARNASYPVSGSIKGGRISIGKGTAFPEYSKSTINTTTIPLQGNTLASVSDGTCDELHIYRDGSRKLIKRTNDIVLKASNDSIYPGRDWIKSASSFNGYYYSTYDSEYHSSNLDRSNIYSDNFKIVSKTGSNEYMTEPWYCMLDNTIAFSIPTSEVTTVAEFETWIDNNPQHVVYPLAKEIEIELDPIDLPEFNAENATAIFNSGIPGLIPDVDVTYWTKLGATVADADSAANNAEDKIDNLDVGATNLALYTDRPKTYIQNGTNDYFVIKDSTDTYRHGPRTSDLGLSLLKKGGEFTVSFDWAAVNVPKAFEFYVALEYQNGSYKIFGSTYTMPKQAAVSGHFVTTSVPSAEQMEWGRGFLFGGIGSGTNYPDFEITISNFKFEKGNKETTWSQAPEELASGEYVDDIEESISSDIAGLEETISEAFINIDSINAKMEFLVTDENGNSMMTQTSDGWTFNMSSIQNTVDKAIEDIDTIHGDLSSANKIINDTKNLVDDISQKTSYINLGQDESGSPCILLGDTASPFKLRITNTSIDFMEGSDKIAYVTNRQLYIQSSVVTDEMRVGSLDQNTGRFEGFVWKKRANGNMGLRWEG